MQTWKHIRIIYMVGDHHKMLKLRTKKELNFELFTKSQRYWISEVVEVILICIRNFYYCKREKLNILSKSINSF